MRLSTTASCTHSVFNRQKDDKGNLKLNRNRGREGRDRGGGERPKKKGRGGGWAIDPLDPTGKTGGKWSEGLVQVIITAFYVF